MLKLSSSADDPKIKLRHARKRFKDLENISKQYLAGMPFDTEIRETETAIEHYLIVKKLPPVEIALLAGEAISSLRSALDYRALYIAEYFKGAPLAESQASKIYFPNFASKKIFFEKTKHFRKPNHSYGRKWLKVFSRLQPFSGLSQYWETIFGRQQFKNEHLDHQRYLNSTLSRMIELSNHEKHRRIQSSLIVPSLFMCSSDGNAPEWKIKTFVPKNGDLVAYVSKKDRFFKNMKDSQIDFGLYLPNADVELDLLGEIDAMIYCTKNILDWTDFEFKKLR